MDARPVPGLWRILSTLGLSIAPARWVVRNGFYADLILISDWMEAAVGPWCSAGSLPLLVQWEKELEQFFKAPACSSVNPVAGDLITQLAWLIVCSCWFDFRYHIVVVISRTWHLLSVYNKLFCDCCCYHVHHGWLGMWYPCFVFSLSLFLRFWDFWVGMW